MGTSVQLQASVALPQGMHPRYQITRKEGKPQGWSGRFGDEKNFCLCRESKYDPSSYVQPVALDTTPIILSGLTSHHHRYFNSVYVNSDYRTQGVLGSVRKYRCGA